jgi:tripartite ATP-independent transporter DctM subunit
VSNALDILMFLTACVLLVLGYPVAFTLAGVGLAFALIGAELGVFDTAFLKFLPQRIYGNMTNDVLVAVPLFIFMGVMLERSRVAEDLLDTMGRLFGRLRGGLGISVSIVGALLAASTGIVGATVVTMGLLSLPTMLKRGYAPGLAAGSIAAAGTLGQIIPPSIVLVLLGDVIANAHQGVQRGLGHFDFRAVSVGDLFAGALVPGLLLVSLYILYQALVAWLSPSSSPALPADDLREGKGLGQRILIALLPPLVLIVAVLGSILAGVATPTEAAALGATGALLLAGYKFQSMELQEAAVHGTKITMRLGPWPIFGAGAALIGLLVLTSLFDLRLARSSYSHAEREAMIGTFVLAGILALGLWTALWRVYRNGCLVDVMRTTMKITCMVFVVLIGAAIFSLVFRGLGGDETVREALTGLPGGAFGAMAAVMIVMFVLGFFLDFIEIIFVVVPVVAPVLLQMGFDPVWLGVMMAVNLQTSFLTPPFGFALFYLQGVAPPSLRTIDLYRGILPFIAMQLLALALIAAAPALATFLPQLIFGK